MLNRGFQVSTDPKRFEWIGGGKVLIWAFVPSEEIRHGGEGEIDDRTISVVTKLETTEDLDPEEKSKFPFTGKFFRVYDEDITYGASRKGGIQAYVLVTKEAVYRFEKNMSLLAGESYGEIKVEKIIPEPTELDVWVPISNGLCNIGSRYASQFEMEGVAGGYRFFEVDQPAKLTVAELREHLK